MCFQHSLFLTGYLVTLILITFYIMMKGVYESLEQLTPLQQELSITEEEKTCIQKAKTKLRKWRRNDKMCVMRKNKEQDLLEQRKHV